MHNWGLATLLEGAGCVLFLCKWNILIPLILFGGKSAVKLENGAIIVRNNAVAGKVL